MIDQGQDAARKKLPGFIYHPREVWGAGGPPSCAAGENLEDFRAILVIFKEFFLSRNMRNRQ